MYRILIGVLMLLSTQLCYALSQGKLLSQSSSGRTVVFDLGRHDGIVEGEYAVIVKQIRSNDRQDLRYVPAAKAKNIKVSTDSSIWILYFVFDGELLVNGEKFSVLTESNILKGQRPLNIGRTTVVAPKGQATEIAKDAISNDRDRLNKLGANYQVLEKAHTQTSKSNKDIELIDLEEWEKIKGERYRTALFRSPNKDEFRRAYRLEAFQNIVGAYLERVNNPNFTYEKFYDDQMRENWSNEFRKKSSVANEYDDFLYNQSVKATEDARIYRSILEKGESWSEDFSDEELRKVLRSVSVVKETDRRDYVVSRPVRNAVYVEYGFIMNDPQTKGDLVYRKDRLYEVGVEYEVTPFLRHDTLEKLTFSLAGKMSKTAFANNGSNVDFDLLTASLSTNWYPFYAPYVVNAPLTFLGVFVRSGYGTANHPATNIGAKYGAFSFPGFRGGLRYNFRNNLGLRIVGSVETLKLEKYEVNKLDANLDDEVSLFEAKLDIGLSYSF